MKSIYGKLAAGFLIWLGASSICSAANFSPANLVVERVGDGSITLSASATNVFLDEFLPATAAQSSPVQTINLPRAATRPTASPFNFMDTGNASTDGQLTRSADGSLILMAGYNGIVGDTSLNSSDGIGIPRVIGVVNSATSVDTSRTMNAFTNGNNFRSVVSVDGSAFWCAGANTAASSSSLRGVVYFTNGTATRLMDYNVRFIGIAANQLFYSTTTGSGAIVALGSGLPTSGSPAGSIVITNLGNPAAFQFNATTNICYIADTSKGIFKYSYSGGIWISNYLFSVSGGAFGLAVDWSGANPVMYATSSDSSDGGRNLLKITDIGASATATILATVDGSTKAFRGVTLAPKASTSILIASSHNPAGFKDSISFTATLPTTATGNVIFKTNSVALSTNTISAGSATSATTTLLPRGNVTITAEYGGDNYYFGSTNSFTQNVTNHPPVAANLKSSRASGFATWQILVSDLLTNVTDTDGDTISLTSISASTNGAAPVIVGGNIFYTNINNVADQFTYNVSDNFGGTASAQINIAIAASGQPQSVAINGSAATVNFSAVSGYDYEVLRSTNLINWSAIFTTNPATGIFQFTDNFSDLGGTIPRSAYYRLGWNH